MRGEQADDKVGVVSYVAVGGTSRESRQPSTEAPAYPNMAQLQRGVRPARLLTHILPGFMCAHILSEMCNAGDLLKPLGALLPVKEQRSPQGRGVSRMLK